LSLKIAEAHQRGLWNTSALKQATQPIQKTPLSTRHPSQFFIAGVVHYRGPFSRSPDYITKFCFAVVPIKESNAVRPTYQPCLYWNCADDDCNADKAAYEAALRKQNTPLVEPK
jgi:hypothetical protein